MSQTQNESNDIASNKEAEQIIDETLTLQTPPTLTVAAQLKRLEPCSEIPNIIHSNAMVFDNSSCQYATSSCQYATSSCQYETSTCQCETSSVHQCFTTAFPYAMRSSCQYSTTPITQVKEEDKVDTRCLNDFVSTSSTSKRRRLDIASAPKQDHIPIVDSPLTLPEQIFSSFKIENDLQRYIQNTTGEERSNSFFNMYLGNNVITHDDITETTKLEREVNGLAEGKHSIPYIGNNIAEIPKVETEVNELAEEKHSIVCSKKLSTDDWSYEDKDGDTLLHLLVAQDSDKTNEVLDKIPIGHECINAANKLQQTPLHIAMCSCVNEEKSLKFIKQFLERSDSRDCMKRADHEGNTPLQIGCLCQNYTKVEALLEHGKKADFMPGSGVYDVINELNNNGLSAIHLAADNQDLPMIRLLKKHGGDIDIRDGRSGKTILMRALQYALELENPTKKADTITFATQLLNEFNVHVNTECYGGNTALHYACLLNEKDMVSLLLKKGSDAGLKNHNKKTEKDLTTDNEIKDILEKKLRKRRRSRNKDSTSLND